MNLEPGDPVILTDNGRWDGSPGLSYVYAEAGTPGVVVQTYRDYFDEVDIAIVDFTDDHPSGKPIRQHVPFSQLFRG